LITTHSDTWDIKTWRGLIILEHFKLNPDGTETNMLENREPYMKKQLKVLRV